MISSSTRSTLTVKKTGLKRNPLCDAKSAAQGQKLWNASWNASNWRRVLDQALEVNKSPTFMPLMNEVDVKGVISGCDISYHTHVYTYMCI